MVFIDFNDNEFSFVGILPMFNFSYNGLRLQK